MERELHEHLERLPEPKQREVVEYARGLAVEKPKGISGKEFLALTGTLEPDDVALMKKAIEEECERVDLNNSNFATGFLIFIGALSLFLGFFREVFNSVRAFSDRLAGREQRSEKHVAHTMLAPIFFYGFGLMCIDLALRLPWFWFIFSVLYLVLFDVAMLAARRR